VTTWHAVRVWPDAAARDAVTQVLFDHGSEALQDDGPSIVTSFPAGHNVAALRAAIDRAAPGTRVDVVPLPDVDWSEQWKGQLRSHEIGTLTIAPPWLATPGAIIIEPAMAFGTGDHATTRGMLYLLQDVIVPGDFVADLGAGSAILSIAAAKLGAARVAAIEIDAEAIGNAEENVRSNEVAACVQVIQGDALVLLPLLAPVDVIVANIISSVLIELLPVMDAALARDGSMILSGILRAECEHMLSVLNASGWTLREEITESEWWSASFRRAGRT
jgi:ribosomal protein L11 methyltransferase